MARMWGEMVQSKVRYRKVSLEEFKKQFPIEGEVLLSATYLAEFGYAGHDSTVLEHTVLGFRERPEDIKEWMIR